MKKILLIILAFFYIQTAFAHTETTVKSKVKDVTVFLNGAQVFRQGSFAVQKGISKIVFENVSPFINPKSIQAKGLDGLMILDVKHDIRYIEPAAVKPTVIPDRIHKEMARLSDSLTVKRFQLEQIASKIAALNRIKTVLGSNAVLSTDSLALLMKAIVFYREKTDEMDSDLFKWKLKQYRQKAVERRMKSRLAELNNFNKKVGQPAKAKKTIHQIVVTVTADRAISGNLKVNYLVTNAGWYPSYDLRAASTNQALTLTYKARVFQNTGEKWDDVNLTLSTFNQQCFTSKPSMPSWVLSYNRKNTTRQNLRQQINPGYVSNFAMPTNNATVTHNNGYEQIVPQNQTEYQEFQNQMAQINQSFANVEFVIKHKYSIEPDGEPILMVVQNQNVPAKYNHYILPKANKDAFLMAKIGDWEDLNLLPGKANIYFESTYVGETQINPAIISDTLEIALGRDRGLVTTRKKLKDEEATRFLGGRKTKTITIEVVVHNAKSSAVEISLEDQIPISGNEDIKVALLEAIAADHKKTTGFLEWDFKLKPKETRTILFTYSVESAKGKMVF